MQGPTAAVASAGGKRDSLPDSSGSTRLEAPSTPQSGSRRNSESVIQVSISNPKIKLLYLTLDSNFIIRATSQLDP